MENTPATISFIIETSKPNKEGKFPIKLNIYWLNRTKRYGIAEYVTKTEWKKLNKSNLKNPELKALKNKMNRILDKAERIISKMEVFSIVTFEEEYFSNKPKIKGGNNDLVSLFSAYIQELKENEQLGTAISYQTTINSIQKFKKKMMIHDVTPRFLQAYENYMLKQGKSVTTVGINMRQLRAIVNRAIRDNILSREKYPFDHYKIPTGRNKKKALSIEGLTKLLEYQTVDEKKRKALDFWLFSYLCNGMNFSDIAYLKKTDLEENYLSFIRQKTKRTKKKDIRPIRDGLNPRAKSIIKKYRSENVNSPFLFSILEPNLTQRQEKYKIQTFIVGVNNLMKVIGEELDIKQPVTTYAARHSFSTTLKRKGVPTSYIMEALGHSSMQITEHYLDSFTDDVKLTYANLLTDL